MELEILNQVGVYIEVLKILIMLNICLLSYYAYKYACVLSLAK